MAESNVNVLAEFSPNGDYLACSDSSGALQIWETSTGTKRQQYIPSSHLSATCSCISWAPRRRNTSEESPSKKKKKRRSDVEKLIGSLELIAVGTAAGSILLYSRTKNGLHTQLTDGHTDRVTDVCWSEEDSELYSCSYDGHIVQWSISKSQFKHKWKADEAGVFSLCLCHTHRHLLSASRNIKLWDLDTRQVLQTITGHQWPVFRVLHVPAKTHQLSESPGEVSASGSYVISADNTDRHVSIWQLNSSSKKKSVRKTVASLTLPDNPAQQLKISCSQLSKLQLAALTTQGKLVIFEHVLNGPSGAVMPEHVVEVRTSSEAGAQLPVRAVTFSEADASLTIAYSDSNFLQPVFEKLQAEELKDKKVCLVREAPSRSVVSVQESLSKLRTPKVSEDVTVLTPRNMAPSVPVVADDESGIAKKRRRRHSLEITVEERLNAIGVGTPSDEKSDKHTPKTDSLATILAQGLLSKDKNMLNNVLQHHDINVIQQTVRRLPLHAIVPLVKELSVRMGGHAQSALGMRLWLKSVVTTHASYLMTLPDRDSILGPLHQVMETRLDVLKKVCQLQGRLDLILAQVESKTATSERWKAERSRFVYNDESSDEDFAIDVEDGMQDEDVLSADEQIDDEEMKSVDDDDDDDGLDSEKEDSNGSDREDNSSSLDAD